MEPLLSVGNSEIEGNCADQFKLDEFLWKVLITASPFFLFFLYAVFTKLFIAAHCAFFCHVSNCALFFVNEEGFIGRADDRTWKWLIRLLSRRLQPV